MHERAILLRGDRVLSDDRRAAKLLEFFGVAPQKQSAFQFRFQAATSNQLPSRLFTAVETFARILEQLESSNPRDGFEQQIHSIFLYSSGDPIALSKLIKQLCGNDVRVRRGASSQTEWTIADDPDGICGAMRGVRVYPTTATLSSCDFFDANQIPASRLIFADDKAAFLKLHWRGIPVFISSVGLLDIDAELGTRNFDVRDHFFQAVPFVSYVRWAFPTTAWNAPEAHACLIIDDPLLKPKYGFICYRELLVLMKQLRFSATIAFIPWNWNRSNPQVVRLFKENPESYSLCVHGCDHTRNEFNTSNRRRLRLLTSEAFKRMSLHEQRNGLSFDRIMVFPQGAFSPDAVSELKHAGFHAVVNTEVTSKPPGRRELRISDALDVAVMSYSSFPIYSRRPPVHGIENFAFDLLVGKPCVIVIHHEFCRDGYSRLIEFVNQLNQLRVPLVWRSIGEVVSRSYRGRQVSCELVEIEMYGSQLVMENRSDSKRSYFIRRREDQPESLEGLSAGTEQLSWGVNGNYIEFRLTLQPYETTLVTVHFKPSEFVAYDSQNIVSFTSTMLRRYLSEARDNYVTPVKARIGNLL